MLMPRYAHLSVIAAVSVLFSGACASRDPRVPAPAPGTERETAEPASPAQAHEGLIVASKRGEDASLARLAAKTGDDAKGDGMQPSFPAADVRTALLAASRGLRSCGDGRSHSYKASLRFDPSGRVGRVEVVPSDGPTAACVERRLAEVSVTSFTGEAVTVVLPVDLAAL
jgi:hypothetical protein